MLLNKQTGTVVLILLPFGWEQRLKLSEVVSQALWTCVNIRILHVHACALFWEFQIVSFLHVACNILFAIRRKHYIPHLINDLDIFINFSIHFLNIIKTKPRSREGVRMKSSPTSRQSLGQEKEFRWSQGPWWRQSLGQEKEFRWSQGPWFLGTQSTAKLSIKDK